MPTRLALVILCALVPALGQELPRNREFLTDYEIVVREGRRPLPPGLPPPEVYRRACAQGFADACGQASEPDDAPGR